jgi:transposase-like protein
MNTCKRHRFSSDVIRYAVWLYYRFNLSYNDVGSMISEPRPIQQHQQPYPPGTQ